jgi:hypothetical protein
MEYIEKIIGQKITSPPKERLEGHTLPILVKSLSACSGGCPLLIRCIGVEQKASCGVLEGQFCQQRPWL